ncbi:MULTISPECIES: hypothetical protein [Anoxybacillaceae]|uniref:Uncharacterized protein n=2 Tax=Anoxybacillaceae TaxID=3120669 RepID=A0A023DKD3_9BACL|nr:MULTISPECIES: hypothetical protein [Bacillaceae]ANB57706.1 hypothetical protein GFC28_1723 [Anoxybacillus sp. B2M1]ANB63652.1 hypothetical protein GFC29_3711 [Anoxybacillus sp. B7M1]MBB3854038.1 hypothetical protein [Parageobacillus caldoxylosilyticus]MBB3907402.1 hypothetical protein [Anoxybacillus rupiensis]MED5053735.1 hypothetical protein [Anoxybacillus rupiensis]
MKKAVVYITYGKEQVNPTYEEDTLKRIEKYCFMNNIEIVKVFKDVFDFERRSPILLEREGIMLWKEINNNRAIKLLITNDFDNCVDFDYDVDIFEEKLNFFQLEHIDISIINLSDVQLDEETQKLLEDQVKVFKNYRKNNYLCL